MTTQWTDYRIESLIRMWTEGKTSSYISRIFKTSRGAVLGKLKHLGLMGKRKGKSSGGKNKYHFKDIPIGHTEHYLCDSSKRAQALAKQARSWSYHNKVRVSTKTMKDNDFIIVAVTRVY